MNAKKETDSRRGILEISRAVSTTAWPGTISANFASPGANPGVTHANPIPYQAEMHDTRYQYTFAMTPDSLRKDPLNRTEKTLRALQNLRRVGGNHGRFLYDFSPEAIVLRVTHDPAPRIMFCFDEDDAGALSARKLVARMQGDEKDVEPGEVVIGTVRKDILGLDELKSFGVDVRFGIKAAVSTAIAKVKGALKK
jgi:CRISPR-associated protein Cst2